jgi:hypothetical protein
MSPAPSNVVQPTPAARRQLPTCESDGNSEAWHCSCHADVKGTGEGFQVPAKLQETSTLHLAPWQCFGVSEVALAVLTPLARKAAAATVNSHVLS